MYWVVNIWSSIFKRYASPSNKEFGINTISASSFDAFFDFSTAQPVRHGKPIFLTPYVFPTINADIEIHEVLPGSRFLAIRELNYLQYNDLLFHRAVDIIGKRNAAFIYQRYSKDVYYFSPFFYVLLYYYA